MYRNLRLFIIIFFLSFISCSGGSGDVNPHAYTLPDCYRTLDEIDEFIDTTANDYPSIVSVKTLGYSVSGRAIRCIIISDNPDSFENEPCVRLTGGIHGNEPVGVELVLRYAQYLTENYAADSTVKGLVDSRYIVIVPVLNPDGYVSGTRYNANYVDLNRNFDSDYYVPGGIYGSAAFSEPESRAIRDMISDRVIHSSITFHSGEVIVNLPFDYGRGSMGVLPGENDFVKYMGKAYSMAGTSPYIFKENPDLYDSAYVEDGVINGGDWYVITGSLQDWSYLEYGCLDITVEVALSDPEDEAGLAEVFSYNRDGITAYIEHSGYGVYGRVTDSGGNPVSGVEVYVSGGDLITKTDLQGYYFKILDGGDYTLNFVKTGYTSVSETVTVTTGGSIERNVTMNSH